MSIWLANCEAWSSLYDCSHHGVSRWGHGNPYGQKKFMKILTWAKGLRCEGVNYISFNTKLLCWSTTKCKRRKKCGGEHLYDKKYGRNNRCSNYYCDNQTHSRALGAILLPLFLWQHCKIIVMLKSSECFCFPRAHLFECADYLLHPWRSHFKWQWRPNETWHSKTNHQLADGQRCVLFQRFSRHSSTKNKLCRIPLVMQSLPIHASFFFFLE